MGTFGMLSGLLRGEHMPIFSFLLIFSDLLPILTGLVLWAGHFQCQDIIFFKINHMAAVLSNRTCRLLWFEIIAKCWFQLKNNLLGYLLQFSAHFRSLWRACVCALHMRLHLIVFLF